MEYLSYIRLFVGANVYRSLVGLSIFIATTCFSPISVVAFDWSKTELHYQFGNLDAPYRGGRDSETNILTFQHADGWKYGDNFIFIDFLHDADDDGFNDDDIYGEVYFNFSLSKILDTKIGGGPIKDIGILAGLNMGLDAEVVKYLPGIRFSWDVEGFAFLNTDITFYIDGSNGLSSGGVPKEDNSFMVDVNYAYPLRIASHSFSIEGHMEYIGERTDETGASVSEWYFAQTQFRYYVSELFDKPEKVFVGIEWQLWINKLGDPKTDENVAQFLMGYRF
jgi:nucleoside-specific outer membrane channel protein Tsx